MIKRRKDSQGHVLSVLRNMGTTQKNSKMLAEWGITFSYPKPVQLISYLVSVFTRPDEHALVLDLFAGSGTTAHAVMSANATDGGDRRYMQVQFAEHTQAGNRQTTENIAELARRRIIAAGSAVKAAREFGPDVELDTGFRLLRVDTTNMADVLLTPDALAQGELDRYAESVKPDRTGEDLLFQVLLDWGLELTLPITTERIDDHEVFVVEDGALIACFEKKITSRAVREMASREPLRVVFLDVGFATDADRINAEQIFAEVSPSTEVKAI